MKKHLFKWAMLLGLSGLVVTVFMMIVYYMHIPALSYTSIEEIRYAASALSAAIAFFAFSLGTGLIALASYSERKSYRLMLVTTLTIIIGYFFPSERLWRLGYTFSLIETLIIAVVHIALLISSTFFLRMHYYGGA